LLALQPIVLASNVPLGFVPVRVLDDLVTWAERRPDIPFVAERAGGIYR